MAKKPTKKTNQKEDILEKIHEKMKETSSLVNSIIINNKKDESKEEKTTEFIKNKLSSILNKTEINTSQTKKIFDRLSDSTKLFSSIDKSLKDTANYTKQQTEISQRAEDRREEVESENSQSESDYRRKSLQALDEIKKNTSIFGGGGRGGSGGGGGGGGIGKLLSGLGIAASVAGLLAAAGGAADLLYGGERPKTVGTQKANESAAGVIGGSSASTQMGARPKGVGRGLASRLIRGGDAAVEIDQGRKQVIKGGKQIGAGITGKPSAPPPPPPTPSGAKPPPAPPTPSGAKTPPATPKMTAAQRTLSAIKGTGNIAGGTAKIGVGSGRAVMQGGRIGAAAGATSAAVETTLNWRTLTDPNIPLERKKEIVKGIAKGVGRSALAGVGYQVTSTALRAGLMATGSKLAGQIATRLIPGVGWALLAYDLVKTAMNASEQGRAIAEGQIWEQKNAEFEKYMGIANEKTVEAQGITELMKQGQIPDNEIPDAEKAVEERMKQAETISNSSRKELYKWHSITQTQDALDKIVNMDGWFWAGQVYSLEDAVNMINALDKKPREWDDKVHGSWNDQSTYDKLLLVKQGYFPSIGYVNKLIEGIGIDKTQMLFDQGKEATKDYRQLLWTKPDQYEQKYFPNKDSMVEKSGLAGVGIEGENPQSSTPNSNVETNKNTPIQIPGAGVEGEMPEARTEAIHPGDSKKRGNPVVIGDGPGEAVLSTRHNFVTEQIGKNIYNLIKEEKSNDFKSLQREESMIVTALNNTISSFFESYVMKPALGKGQDSSRAIVNNFMPPITQNRKETNASFNRGGMDSVNTETILQRVYLESYKAQLL